MREPSDHVGLIPTMNLTMRHPACFISQTRCRWAEVSAVARNLLPSARTVAPSFPSINPFWRLNNNWLP